MQTATDERRTVSAAAREIKFVVTADQAAGIRAWARRELDADPHGQGPSGDQYVTTSLYFDTPARDVIGRRASYGRAKYRIRRYGAAEWVFAERKLRTGSRLAKRRTAVALTGLHQLIAGTEPADADWFRRRLLLRGLAPVCQVRYVRTARVLPVASGVARLTLDEDVSVSVAAGLAFADAEGTSVAGGQVIVEMKVTGQMPAAFRRLAETFALSPTAFSKYRAAMACLEAAPVPTELLCA